jgi:hypothetical protein
MIALLRMNERWLVQTRQIWRMAGIHPPLDSRIIEQSSIFSPIEKCLRKGDIKLFRVIARSVATTLHRSRSALQYLPSKSQQYLIIQLLD